MSVASSSSSNAADNKIPSSRSHHAEHASRKHTSSAKRPEKPSASSSPADQAFETYKMSAVNKLVNELAYKQQECRKAKLHTVVSLKVVKTLMSD